MTLRDDEVRRPIKRLKTLLPAAFLAASGCAMTPADDSARPCPVASAGGWRAWVDLMPGTERPKLWVTGKVTAPTGGWSFAIERGPIQEIYPAVQEIILRSFPPAGPATQAVTTYDVQGQVAHEQEIGTVTVRCGSEILAGITNVGRAY